MATKSNQELQELIDEYTHILEARKSNKETIEPWRIAKWQGFEVVDTKNIQKIEKSKYVIGEPTQIAHWYYPNLDLYVMVYPCEDDMICLEYVEKRMQCESDSGYESSEVSSGYDSDEIHVTKIRDTFYLTKTDFVNLLNYLKTK